MHRLNGASIVLLISSLAVFAQTPDTATLLVRATNQNQGTVAGVKITIRNNQTDVERTALTDASGDCSFAGLPVFGSYDVTAHQRHFADARVNGLMLLAGTTATIEIELKVNGMASTVMVTGSVDGVQSDEPQLGNHLTTQQMDAVPLLNRRITYLPLLNAANRPAITQGDAFVNQSLINTNGTGRRQVWFEVDGSNAVDDWGRQTIFSSLPLDAVQEMTVLTNAFSAEYGFTAGSVINIVTKSGGDRFHGDLLGLWRPSSTAARLSGFTPANASNGSDLTSDALRQTSLALSGPIDQSTQFSLAGEYSWENRASPVTSVIAPGDFIGHYRGWLAFLRIDHQFGNNNGLFFRSDADSFYDTNPNGTVGGNNLPSVDRVFKRRTYTEELGETAVLSPSLLNSVRAQFQLASPITQFAPVIYGTQFTVPISTGGTFTSGTSQSAVLMNRQYDLNDTVSKLTSRHTIKFGGAITRSHSGGNGKEFGGPIYAGQFKYLTCTQSLDVCESPAYLDNINNVQSYTQSYGNASYTVDDTLWSLFIQDDYRLRPHLTIDLGLRYERQTFTSSTKGFAPRVGFAYNLRGDGKTVIRSGFGIYYSQIVDNSEANYALTGPTGVFNYTAAPGQVGFPTGISEAPLPIFPPGAVQPLRSLYIRPGESAYLNQFFPTSTLIGYPDQLLNPYTEQWTFGVQREISQNWLLSVDYVGSHTLKIDRPLDVDAPAPFIRTSPGQTRSAQAADCTRPYWIWWYTQNNMTCNPTASTTPEPAYDTILSDVNDGLAFYDALDVNLSHHSRRASVLVSYTWSHAIDNVDPDIPSQSPNDANFTGQQEVANAIFDQRHRLVLSGAYTAPFRFTVGGIATLASGLPYNIVSGTNNSGDTGGTTDRPVINGAVIGRNAGRGDPLYEVSPFVERGFALNSESMRITFRAEAFNVLNHANFVGYSGTWGNGAAPGPGFGQPLTGVNNQLPARNLQFSARLSF